MNVSFNTLGCKVNQFETEAMMELFEKRGYTVVESSEVTDIFVINTCAVTSESDRKSRQIINKSKRINAKAIVIAVGCSVQIHKDTIGDTTCADIIIGSKDKANIVDYLEKYIKENHKINMVEAFDKKENFEELSISKEHDKTRANIKIQDGCNMFCSYCIIPYTRGPIRSRKSEDIIKEIRTLAENGYKEVVINGIHVASYGKDRHEKDALINLLEEIDKIEGLERIRFGSLEPKIIDDDFMLRISNMKKICDHFHLSLQSGSDSVLKAMNRKYTSTEYSDRVDLIRKYMPDAGITTDIIVGFAGETDENFQETMDFVKKIRFSRIHVFRYSIRQGTKAADFKNQINGNVKSERSHSLMKLADEMTDDFLNDYIGKEVEILVEKKEKDYFEGYTSNYLKSKIYGKDILENELVKVTVKRIENEILICER